MKHLEEMIASWSEEKRARFDRATNVGWHVTETDNIGLMSEEAARSEMQNSETLHRLGVAGSRVAAVIALDELPYEREDGTYELRTATQSGLQPAEAIRVMSCEFRVRDMFAYAQDPAVSKEEMFQMFTRDVKSFEKPIDYVIWFAMTLGRNIALVHNARLTHNFVTDHNILPDATFADSGDLTSFDGALIPQHVDIEDIDNWKLTVDELADMLDLPEADKLFNEGQKFFLRLAMDYRGGIETVGDICDMCREKQLLSEDEITGMLVVFSSSYERQIRLSCEGGDTWRAYWVELAKSKVPPKLRDALFPIQLNAK